MAKPAEPKSTAPAENNVYSVWALPQDDVAPRLKKLMQGLRDEFSGPEFEPHITVVGAISLTPEDALNKFKSASRGLKAYDAKVDRVATGTFFYQCVFLLINPTPQVVETSAHCCAHFGFNSATRKFLYATFEHPLRGPDRRREEESSRKSQHS
ncbi:cyclic phosphodiesterase-like isoform X2 [Prunus dulcis]|uniref:cyclic phosphodiesterase-like isoform X2 n=1 Tax=Prunus dulcis TaxID=3755 RepID=UPI0014830C74|nr:cyclic phosphodiesterase-like isoform X2 [Prunus dulcis]